jgi:hypothetical protein
LCAREAHGLRNATTRPGNRKAVRSLANQSMIPKEPAPDLIRGGDRFSEKIMLKQRTRLLIRFN